MATALINLSNELAAIVQNLAPRVVSVRGRRRFPSSGVLWSSGVVVTADHALQRDEDISVVLPGGKALEAALIGRDPGTDLAALKIDPAVADSPALDFAAHSELKPGELALVLGRSPDSGVNASLGIVSAVSGPWRPWRGGQLDAYIRLDAKLFPRSSGGAVVNMRGQIIGIATAALSRIAGLAIPTSTVKRVTEKLLEKGFVPRGYLGIGVQPVALPGQLRERLSISATSGLLVITVETGAAAEKAGLLIGDILIRVGDTSIERIADLQAFSDEGVIGSSAKAQFIRGGSLKDATLTIGERPRR